MFDLPILSIQQTLFYLAAAVLPAAVLMFYVYKKDTIEKEPRKVLGKCILGGLFAAVAALILETGADAAEQWYFSTHAAAYETYIIVTAVVIGLIEEGAKMFFLKRFTWHEPDFNFRFDGIVYAVFVSLGFAAIENVLYIFFYNAADVAFQRAILTIPAHMSFAVYMGMYYGRAKADDIAGNSVKSVIGLWTGFLEAVLLHAVYDGSLMLGSDMSLIFFYVFVVLLDIYVWYTIRRESRTDEPIY